MKSRARTEQGIKRKVKFDEQSSRPRYNFDVSWHRFVSQMVSYRGQLGRFSRRKSKGDVNQRITSGGIWIPRSNLPRMTTSKWWSFTSGRNVCLGNSLPRPGGILSKDNGCKYNTGREREREPRNERRFRQLHRGGRKSFRTFMVLNLPRNTRHKGIKILWRLVTCNRDLRAEHDGIYVYAAKIRKISATSNVPITRFRFDELVKNNLLFVKNNINCHFCWSKEKQYISETTMSLFKIRAIGFNHLFTTRDSNL